MTAPVDSLFNRFLVLHRPFALPLSKAGRSRVVLYFSTCEVDGVVRPICISSRADTSSSAQVYPHGTQARVVGMPKTIGQTVFVVAVGLFPSAPSVQPLRFASPTWAALLMAGVVSTPELAVVQPELTVDEVLTVRQHGWRFAPLTVRCKIDGDENLGFNTVVISGVLIGFTDKSFTVGVDAVYAEMKPVAVQSAWSTVLAAVLQCMGRAYPTKTGKTIRFASPATGTVNLNAPAQCVSVGDDGYPRRGVLPQLTFSTLEAPSVHSAPSVLASVSEESDTPPV